MSAPESEISLNFIEEIVEHDLATHKHGRPVLTRFPPEPNGYLHIGHAKSICLNFGLAQKYGGKCNLRFDDTNPVAEDQEYVDSIKADIKWLGFDWDAEYYASDYFDQLFDWALLLVDKGLAYVDDSSADQIAEMRAVPTRPGIDSPFRSRSIEENRDLFLRMKAGEFEEGEKTLRAKIDMESPNMHLRDPIMYRILKKHHHRTGDKWCIYPMYDWAHGQSDSIEMITHSICTLEFEVHRPLYDWYQESLGILKTRQIEFARLNLTYTMMSKRNLRLLVTEGLVSGWDDPRMPTISGMRRRGFPPAALRHFATRVGVAKRNALTDMALLEHSIREELNKTTARVMAVIEPLKVVITNYPEGQVENMSIENNPEDEGMGSRTIPFSREIYIEQSDFMENPPPKYFRLAPGGMVRLKGAYIIQCNEVIKDESGNLKELRCTYFPDSKSGSDTSGIKVKGVTHFVSKAQALDVEVRMYDRLFTVEEPLADKERDFREVLNPDSLEVLNQVKVEPSLASALPGERFQFMRMGYFTVDPDSCPGKLVFNRTITLRDTWGKINA